MKSLIATVLLSILFVGSAFAQYAAPPPAGAGGLGGNLYSRYCIHFPLFLFFGLKK